ncbi:hypothetical protein [Streptomyces sp. NPDC058268]|uniref:hypothetical protein n=1 Tax=Streptomyces sp. NPDC058268 TaxID=3346413 RepID=UPI0036E40CB3
MSMLTRARGIGRHRGKTPAQLRAELDEAICTGMARAEVINALSGERNRLEAALDETGLELSAAQKLNRHLEAVVHLRDRQIDDLTRKVDVGVKAEHVIAKTQELDGEEIRRHCTKPVPLHQSPMAAVTDPGRVRQVSWGRGVDDTQPLKTVASAT